MDLKAGDKVLIIGRARKSIGVVEKITPVGNIRLKGGGLYAPTGRLKTSDPWSVCYIQPLTPELEEEIRQEKVIEKAITSAHRVKRLTYEQAVKLLEIFKEVTEWSDTWM